MNNTKKLKILKLLIIIFTIEKMLQHFITALLFFITVPGVGTPDIGPNFNISNHTMGVLNIAYFLIFFIGLAGFIKKNSWRIALIIACAVLDIVLEFLFHHFFFITISVIMSIILTIVAVQYLRIRNQREAE